MTRRVVQLLALAAVIAGAVFALQGLSLLPSRVMYGKPEWIVIGSVMIVIGIAALLRSRQDRRKRSADVRAAAVGECRGP